MDDLSVTAPDVAVLHADNFSDPDTAEHYSAGGITSGKLHLDGVGFVPLQPFQLSISPAGLSREDVDLAGSVTDARVYLSGLGSYELYVNGDRVGERELDPGRTDFEETVLYAVPDVTGYLQDGRTAIGVALDRARYGDPITSTFNWANAPWWSDPQLRLQLEITFDDGTSIVVGTDGDWSIVDGPTRFDSLYGGEAYDALKERPGWTEPRFDDGRWCDVAVVAGPAGEATAQYVQPMAAVETVRPVARTQPDPASTSSTWGSTWSGRT